MKNNTIRKIKFFSLIFALLFLILLFYIIVNFWISGNQLEENLNQQVIKYGYLAVFISSFLLEISPQPFASAIVPFTSGLLLGLNFKYLLITTLLGVILSSFTAYILGFIYGKKITTKLIGEENYEKGFNLFKKYGKFAMTIAALTPVPYFPILTGLFKMKTSDFIIYAMLPRILYFVFLGYILFMFF